MTDGTDCDASPLAWLGSEQLKSQLHETLLEILRENPSLLSTASTLAGKSADRPSSMWCMPGEGKDPTSTRPSTCPHSPELSAVLAAAGLIRVARCRAVISATGIARRRTLYGGARRWTKSFVGLCGPLQEAAPLGPGM